MSSDSKELMTFSDYCAEAEFKPAMRAAFETHVRLNGGFNHATFFEWERKKAEFLTMHRGRSGH